MANEIEEIKKKKDGLDVLEDIYRYAKTGFDTIEKTDFPLFRWYGVYQQRPNTGHFMMRLKVPNGDLDANQLRAIGSIANDYGRGLADITTRQTFQYHWLTIESLPEIFKRLALVNLNSVGACGDITRNIVGCPVAGIDATEIYDASGIAKRLSTYLSHNKSFSNLPRKYKISIAGCSIHCAQPDINCVGVYGAWRGGQQGGEPGFGIKVGGGLSTAPFFGADLGVWLKPEQVFDVVVRVTEIYRDAEVLRTDRKKARLKFLLHDPKFGIGAAEFLRQLEERLGYSLERATPVQIQSNTETDHLGIQAQKQPGRHYVGIGVTAGRLNGDMLQRIADVAEEFSLQRNIRLTNKQNFIITHIPEDRLGQLQERLDGLQLDYKPSVFKKGIVSCTGIEFCNLAVAETKELARNMVFQLEERFPSAAGKVRIHFSGCPNNCGQNAIADIGLRGVQTKVDGTMREAFDILLGGTTGGNRAFGEICTRKILKENLFDAIARVYQGYLDWAKNGEPFNDFVRAHDKAQLEAIARGPEWVAAQQAAAADSSAASTPPQN